jgi:hypothetical protein
MSNAQLGFEQQIIQQVFQVLNAGTNPNPQTNPNNSSPGSSTPPDQLHNNLPQLLQNNGQQLTVTVTTTGGGSTTGTATVNTTTTTQQNTTTTGPSDFDLASGTQTISDNETVNNLTIGAGAILTIISPGSLTPEGITGDYGTINVNSTASDPWHPLPKGARGNRLEFNLSNRR